MPEPPATHSPAGLPPVPPFWSDRGLLPPLAASRFTQVRWFDEIDSTNRYLLDEAVAGAPAGVVAVADVQSAGRGRLGRRWEAPRGASLLVSVLLRPALPPESLHLVTAAAAVAAEEVLDSLAGIRAGLKWPNDLVVGDRKIAGLLAEAIPGEALVVGMGLNVHWESFPPELADIATACNLESGAVLDRAGLLVEWLLAFDRQLAGLDADGGAGLRGVYLARSATVGHRVRVDLPGRSVEADATGIDDQGHLLVTLDCGEVETIAAGDVVNLRRT